MTANKRTVERYLEGFRRTDRAAVLACLTEDVEWELPGLFKARGKAEFDRHIVGEGFVGGPEIIAARMTEENGVVVAEGTVRTQRVDGSLVHIAFCDVFEMEQGLIRRLVSYLMRTD